MSKERIAVAMSGGVDSSIAAALLKNKGFDVIGVTIEFWEKACFPHDLEDARKVSRLLQIPHHVIPLQEAFKERVIDYFIAEYNQGRTPNPCAVCNPAIKFGELLRHVEKLGAHRMATGHYAIVEHDPESERYLLRRGRKRSKDQSYFLARLTQEMLSRTLFPVGGFTKSRIREMARRLDLPVAEKSESQEACFIPPGKSVAQFIREMNGSQSPPGPIVDRDGNRIGNHPGIIGFTIGQRKGLGIALGRPVYVTDIQPRSRTVVVGDQDHLYRRAFLASEAHWIAIPSPEKSLKASVRIRYKHRQAPATLHPQGKGVLHITFDRPQRAITPGQLAVFYRKDTVLGSAWIEKVPEPEDL
jgi:tRNA-specific 2-thiouridylase